MTSTWKPLATSACLSVLLAVSVSCRLGGAGEAEPAPGAAAKGSGEAVTTTRELPPLRMPEDREGIVTFLSGDVLVKDGSDWELVEIGALLRQDDVVRIGDNGYCEIQFGGTAVIRLQENSELALGAVFLSPERADVRLNLASGSLFCKVEKLGKGSRFKVKTSSAVCGVRGTEFWVQATSDRRLHLAVREGAVAVLPAALDVDELKGKVGPTEKQLASIVERVDEAAVVVSQEQELSLDPAAFGGAASGPDEMAPVVEKLAAAPSTQKPGKKEVELLEQAMEEAARRFAEQVGLPRAASAGSMAQLQEIDKIRVISIAAEMATGGGTPEEGPLPAVRLIRIAVEAEPANAEIVLNGEGVGLGRFSGLFPEGESLSFQLSREGYAAHTLTLTVDGKAQKLYRVRLAKKAEEPVAEGVTVRTVPEDASILLNGVEVGRGSHTGRYLPGRQLAFVARRDGYRDGPLGMEVGVGTGRTYTIILERILRPIEVRVTPADAEIHLDGRSVGKGGFRGEFPQGAELAFVFRKDGWEEQRLAVAVTPDGQTLHEVSLSELLQGVQVVATPQDAGIYLSGEKVGEGSYSGSFKPGEKLSVRVEKDGYEPQTLQVAVGKTVRTYRVTLQKKLYRLKLATEPEDAAILLGGRAVGNGTFEGRYEEGRELSFIVQKEQWEAQTFNVRVSRDPVQAYTVRLQKAMEEVAIRTSPGDAQILAGGRLVGTGSYEEAHEVGSRLSFVVQRSGYRTQRLDVVVGEGLRKEHSVRLERVLQKLTLLAEPADSQIVLNGEPVAVGSFTGEFEPGGTQTFILKRPGYREKEVSVSTTEEPVKTERVALDRFPCSTPSRLRARRSWERSSAPGTSSWPQTREAPSWPRPRKEPGSGAWPRKTIRTRTPTRCSTGTASSSRAARSSWRRSWVAAR